MPTYILIIVEKGAFVRTTTSLLLATCVLLCACSNQGNPTAPTATPQQQATTQPTASMSSDPAKTQPTPAPVTLEPQRGAAIGTTFEAFLNPHQEPGEEKDTPSQIPEQFRSTAPSLLRSERQSRGHGILRFSNDLSKAYVDLQVLGIKPEDIVLFHIHCGRPDQLGPIIVDFGLLGSLPEQFAGGKFSAVITNDLIERTTASGTDIVGAFTMGCPIPASLSLMGDLSPAKAKTIAGMEYIGLQGDLYFNLHTKGQVYYGDIRGQLHQVATP